MPIVEQWMQSENKVLDINIQFIKYQAYKLLKEEI